MAVKSPLNELMIDSDSFRIQLKEYSIEQMEEYLKKYERYRKDFYKDNIACLLTYLVEQKGEYAIEGKGRDDLGIYLTKGNLSVKGSSGDRVGNGMKDGIIIVNGSVGDAAGYRATGGMLLIEGNIRKETGILMKGVMLICLGKVESVHRFILSRMIYADEFGEVPEKVKKFTSDLQHAFLNEYSWLPKEFKKMFNEVIRKEPEKYFPYANNDEKRKLLSELSGVDERTIEFEYEKGQEIW